MNIYAKNDHKLIINMSDMKRIRISLMALVLALLLVSQIECQCSINDGCKLLPQLSSCLQVLSFKPRDFYYSEWSQAHYVNNSLRATGIQMISSKKQIGQRYSDFTGFKVFFKDGDNEVILQDLPQNGDSEGIFPKVSCPNGMFINGFKAKFYEINNGLPILVEIFQDYSHLIGLRIRCKNPQTLQIREIIAFEIQFGVGEWTEWERSNGYLCGFQIKRYTTENPLSQTTGNPYSQIRKTSQFLGIKMIMCR